MVKCSLKVLVLLFFLHEISTLNAAASPYGRASIETWPIDGEVVRPYDCHGTKNLFICHIPGPRRIRIGLDDNNKDYCLENDQHAYCYAGEHGLFCDIVPKVNTVKAEKRLCAQ